MSLQCLFETRSCSGIADAISLKKISNCALSKTSKFPDSISFTSGVSFAVY
jgi:hypothetical protein